ncbi:MAG: PcfB family protein [Clostridia bacterium]
MTDEVAKEIAQKGFSLTIRGAKLTGKLLFKLVKGALNKLFINKYKEHKAEVKENKKIQKREEAIPKGKISIENLEKKEQGLSSLDLNDTDLKKFDTILKKYHVDYSVVTDKNTSPPAHTLFFKGNEVDAITKAFSEYTNYMIAKETKKADKEINKKPIKEEKKSIKEQLKINKEKVKVASIKKTQKKVKVKTPSEPSR